MIQSTMRARVPALTGLAVAGAQAGHLLAYDLRFGAAAQQIQAGGAHAYFPAFVKTALGCAALLLLAALLVIGAARTVAKRTQPYYSGGGPSAENLLLWGMVGQLPVAILGAAALRWLGTRVESALAELGSIVPASAPLLVTSPVAVHVFAPVHAVALGHATRTAIVKRGPPSSS